MVCIWGMLTFTFNSLRCFTKDLGMLPTGPITIYTVQVLDLDNFEFSSVGKFQYGGLQEQKSQQFGLSCWVLSLIIMSGLLSSIILCVWMLKSQRILKDSFSVKG